jgi:hypothetical protein
MPLERNESNKRADTKDKPQKASTNVNQMNVRDDTANHGVSAYGDARAKSSIGGPETETPATGDTSGKMRGTKMPKRVTDSKLNIE